MKKSLFNFILTILLALALSMFLPWWYIMLAALLASAIVRLRKASTFIVPFLAIALLWITQAWLLSSTNDFTLASKVSILFSLGENPYLMILITGIIGGIVAGVSGLLGNQLYGIFSSRD